MQLKRITVPDLSSAPKIIIWSPSWLDANGQAIVTKRVVEQLETVIWVPAVYKNSKRNSVWHFLLAIWALWTTLLFRSPAAIYIVGSRSNIGFLRDIPAFLPVLFGTRIIAHVHGSDLVDLLTSRHVSGLARLFYRRCEIIIPSSHMLEPLEALNITEVAVCENFLIGEQHVNEAETDAVEPDVLWNSNLISAKGIFRLVDAMSLLNASGTRATLHTIGAPIDDADLSGDALERAIVRAFRHDWIFYHGKVSPNDAYRLVKNAHIVALPSQYPSECQPLAIIQAMCAGKRIIIQSTPALHATIGSYPATVVSTNSVEELQEAVAAQINDIRSNQPARLAPTCAAIKEARYRFSVERFDHQISKILLEPPKRPKSCASYSPRQS